MSLDMINIGNAIYDTTRQIQDCINTLHTYAKEYAIAEKNYRLALGKTIVKLRDKKVPVTIISDIARGKTANLKFERDLAEMKYKTSRDMIQGLQSQLSGLQTLYRRQEEI